MTPRSVEILNSIVHAYIQTGRPVASRTISRLRRHRLSAATVRNVMADLAEEGYLVQPHTSAGRIPTVKAFRLFVHSLTAKRLLQEELEHLRQQLIGVETVADRMERSSHILMEMTQNVGIAAAIPSDSQTLDQVELLALSEGRVLMIVVTRDKMVRNRVVSLDDPVSQSELESIRNYINRNFSGYTLAEARSQLKARMEQASAAYDAILRKLVVLYDKGLLDLEPAAAEVHLEGTSNLVGVDFHLTREKMRELFRALEEKKRILQLLDRFLEASRDEIRVQVGLAEVHPSMRELSLIGLTVPLPTGLDTKIAVLGPMRMDYRKVMYAVLHMGRAFQSIPV